jgi:hypothetical protein
MDRSWLQATRRRILRDDSNGGGNQVRPTCHNSFYREVVLRIVWMFGDNAAESITRHVVLTLHPSDERSPADTSKVSEEESCKKAPRLWITLHGSSLKFSGSGSVAHRVANLPKRNRWRVEAPRGDWCKNRTFAEFLPFRSMGRHSSASRRYGLKLRVSHPMISKTWRRALTESPIFSRSIPWGPLHRQGSVWRRQRPPT